MRFRMSPLVLLLDIAVAVGSAQQPLADSSTSRLPAAVNPSPAIAGAQFGGSMASHSDGGGRNQLVSLSIPAIGDAPFSLTLLTVWKMPSNGQVRQVNDNPFYNSRRIMRDSAGRIYQERWTMVRDLPNLPDVTNMNEPKPQMMSIQISDPIAHVSYDCNVQEKTCRQTDYRPESTASSGFEANGQDGGVGTSKNMGARTIEGIKTEGYQVTTTYTSSASGVTRTSSEVREFWYAPRLGIDLLAEVKSPAIGEQTFQARDLKTAEPAPQYFGVPTGYRVINERRIAAPETGGTKQLARELKTTDALPTEVNATPLPSPPVQRAVATIQATARIVVLDVVAVDAHGQPVKGLKASDFVLSEDGVPQRLDSFTERDANADQPAHPAPAALPPNTFANHAPLVNDTAMTVLLFDTSGLSFSDAAYARDEVAAYLKKVKPGTPMCVFDLDQWDGLRLIQDFTTDTTMLRKAVESKGNEQKPKQFGEFTPILQRGVAMRQLARYLAGFPGRKNLIWFYGMLPPQIAIGRPDLYPDTTTVGEGDFADDLSGVTETLTLNRVALYPVDPRGVIFRWNLLQNIYEQDDIFFQGSDASDAAGATGGKAFVNSNTISKDVSEIVAAGSHYYTVSYTPTNAHWDGGFRRLQARFANGVTSTGVPTAKLRLEYRNGYYAQETAVRPGWAPAVATRRLISYSPLGAPVGAPTLSDAMRYGAVAPFELLFQAHISPQPAIEKIKHGAQGPPGAFLGPQWLHEPYRNYGIHYSVDPEDLQFLARGDGISLDTVEFVAVLYDGYGNVVNSFINTVPLEVNAQDYAKIQRTGLGIELPISVPTKGDYYLRLGVHDLNSGHVGALEIPVSEIKPLPANMTASAATPN